MEGRRVQGEALCMKNVFGDLTPNTICGGV